MDWDAFLAQVIPNPCYERPFVCDGFPSESILIVIGENPATPLSVDWWSFWSSERGFDYEGFVALYLAERRKMGKEISNTRRRLNRFREKGVACVETNAFSNERLDGSGSGTPNYSVLAMLIENMPRLKGVVAHGKVAQEYLSGAKIPDGVKAYATRHFRMESYDCIDSICMEVLA